MELNFLPGFQTWHGIIFLLLYQKKLDIGWQHGIELPFLGANGDGLEPIYSYDNQSIFFTSSRPAYPSLNIWKASRDGDSWSNATKVETPVSSSSIEFEVCISKNNTLYFSSDRPGGEGGLDIYSTKLENNTYKNVGNLGSVINSAYTDDVPFISSDEDYLIFGSDRPGGYDSKHDLYISFRKADNTWTNPKNMGAKVNTDGYDLYPFVSPDGKYLFFTRRQSWNNSPPSNIYWMSSSIIEELRETYGPVGIKEKINEANISVFPNPTTGKIHIKNDLSLQINGYAIMDLSGRTIKQGRVISKTIEMEELEEGIYLLDLLTDKRKISMKIVVE